MFPNPIEYPTHANINWALFAHWALLGSLVSSDEPVSDLWKLARDEQSSSKGLKRTNEIKRNHLKIKRNTKKLVFFDLF